MTITATTTTTTTTTTMTTTITTATARGENSRNVHRLRSAPMQGGRAAAAAQGFTAEGGDLCGYEGGRRGPSHPENADPGLASGDIELSTP